MPPENPGYSVEETPSTEPEVEVEEVAEETETSTEATATDETEVTVDEPLYELPDGRKVTGEQVRAEYSNLMRDYTQKSQRLAEYEKAPKKAEDENIPDWKKPDYVPKTYAEIIEIAENRALERIKEEKLQQENKQKETIALIDAQITEIKKTDPNLDENALFLHANKYGFRDLVKAHENLKAIQDAKLTTEQRTVKNLQSRKNIPVAGAPGVNTPSNGIAYGEHEKYGSALEFMRSQGG